MSLCVPLEWAEGDKGDKRGTCPSVSRPVGGQDRTKPLGLSYVPLAVRGWWERNEEGKERLCVGVPETKRAPPVSASNASNAQGAAT
ncbi:hypothetical protein dqs_1796 [Azoarcus olearius]|nr:hypothetical protein dqs_1796 [Azoarcus olearius]